MATPASKDYTSPACCLVLLRITLPGAVAQSVGRRSRLRKEDGQLPGRVKPMTYKNVYFLRQALGVIRVGVIRTGWLNVRIM